MGTVTNVAAGEQTSLELCIDRAERREDHYSIAQFVHTHDREGTHLKLTIFNDNAGADIEFTEGEWYEVGPLRPDVYQGTVGASPAGSCTFDRIDPPDEPEGLSDGSAGREGLFQQLAASTGRVALDIETIQHADDEEIDEYRDEHDGAVNPDHFSLVCAGLAYQPPATQQLPSPPVAEQVVFAADESDREQARAIGQIAACLYAWDADTLLTYGGQWFDLPVLNALWEDTSHAHPEETNAAMPWPLATRTYYHADLNKPAIRTFGPVTLDDAATECNAGPVKAIRWDAYAHDLDLPTWRREFDTANEDGGSWDDPEQPTLVGTDVLHVGEQYLRADENDTDAQSVAALQALLADYAVDDVRPLFRMATDERFAGHPALALDNNWE